MSLPTLYIGAGTAMAPPYAIIWEQNAMLKMLATMNTPSNWPNSETGQERTCKHPSWQWVHFLLVGIHCCWVGIQTTWWFNQYQLRQKESQQIPTLGCQATWQHAPRTTFSMGHVSEPLWIQVQCAFKWGLCSCIQKQSILGHDVPRIAFVINQASFTPS